MLPGKFPGAGAGVTLEERLGEVPGHVYVISRDINDFIEYTTIEVPAGYVFKQAVPVQDTSFISPTPYTGRILLIFEPVEVSPKLILQQDGYTVHVQPTPEGRQSAQSE